MTESDQYFLMDTATDVVLTVFGDLLVQVYMYNGILTFEEIGCIDDEDALAVVERNFQPVELSEAKFLWRLSK